ncbi:MAG: CHAT domain-containing tetratricopeptide repeat protein [Chitinophagales bacterium]
MNLRIHLQDARRLFEEGKDLFHSGQYNTALEKWKKASKNFEEGKQWESLLETHIEMVHCYYELFQHEKAIQLLAQSLEITNTHLSTSPIWKVRCYIELGKNCLNARQFEEGKQHVLKAIDLLQNKEAQFPLEIAASHHSLAFYYGQIGDFQLQKKHYETALEIKLRAGFSELKSTAETYESLAFCSHHLGLIDDMLEYLKKSLAIYIKKLGDKHPKVAHNYFKISFYYTHKGDIDQALNYIHKSLNLLLQAEQKHLHPIANCYNALGFLLGRKGDYLQQLHYFKQEREVWEQLFEGKELEAQLINNNSNVGYSHTQLGNYEEALKSLHLALKYAKETLGEIHPEVARIQDNIGVVLLKCGRKTEAYAHFETALQMALKFHGKKHLKINSMYQHLGDYYQHIHNFPKQIEAYQKAIIALVTDFNEENYDFNPIIPEHQSHTTELLETLHKKANALVNWYQTTQSIKDLQTAAATYQTTIDFVQQMRQSHQIEGSKLWLSKAALGIFEDTFKAVYQLIEVTKMPSKKAKQKGAFFLLSEQTKAALLLSNVKENEAKANAAIPSKLLEQEQKLKRELTYLEKSIAQQKAKGTETIHPLLLRFQSEYFDAQQAYQQLIRTFEKDYPAYHQLKYNIEMAKVEKIQTYLQQKNSNEIQCQTALLSYFVGKKEVYIFAFTDMLFEVKKVLKLPHFNELIESLQESIQLIDLYDFSKIARRLYGLLIQPIEALISETKKLIILRHDVLEYLPFEVLLTNDISSTSNPSYADLPYLLQRFEICYHYSATLLLNGVPKSYVTKNLPNTFLGLAPVTFNGKEPVELEMESKRGKSKILRNNQAMEQALQQLPNTETEVKEVYQLFQAKKMDAKAFLYGSASKKNLMSEASKHKFLLISTHGFVEDEEAGLSGICLAEVKQEPDIRKNGKEQEWNTEKKNTSRQSYRNTNNETHKHANTSQKDYFLYASDAYHLQLNADLVVLSSCSSGIGKLQKGEGMMAINRGFLYAGASNIVFTQFDIPDRSSSLLVKKLFHYILEGNSYPTALQRAKLEMIQSKGSSPQDWAGFVLIGA